MFAVSASVALYVATVVVPSATFADAVAPSPNTGAASLTSVIVAVTVIVSVFAPSVTCKITTQPFALFPAPHPRASKFGAAANVRAPVAELIANKS